MGKLPFHGFLGFVLIVIVWPINWCLPGLRTHWLFFPLWLGYCLTVDALVFWRKGTSLLTRSPAGYFKLFLISAPVWWLFELINLRTQNWIYDGKQFLTDLQYGILATLSFSTVIPAVFGTAELVSTFNWLKNVKPGVKISPTPFTLSAFFILGCFLLIGILLWPVFFFPFVWLSLYLIIEPINCLLRNRSLLHYTTAGDWRPVFALWVGCLICGFFWEMWNFFSYPKWIYHIPFVDFLHVFEMPVLGYMGYIPFSLELFALYHLIAGLLRQKERFDFVQVYPK
jgi:hypothetical protein